MKLKSIVLFLHKIIGIVFFYIFNMFLFNCLALCKFELVGLEDSFFLSFLFGKNYEFLLFCIGTTFFLLPFLLMLLVFSRELHSEGEEKYCLCYDMYFNNECKDIDVLDSSNPFLFADKSIGLLE